MCAINNICNNICVRVLSTVCVFSVHWFKPLCMCVPCVRRLVYLCACDINNVVYMCYQLCVKPVSECEGECVRLCGVCETCDRVSPLSPNFVPNIGVLYVCNQLCVCVCVFNPLCAWLALGILLVVYGCR